MEAENEEDKGREAVVDCKKADREEVKASDSAS